MLPSKDVNFVGYTYKNFEIVNDHEVPGIGCSLSSTFLSYCLVNSLTVLLCIIYIQLNWRKRVTSQRGQPSNHCLVMTFLTFSNLSWVISSQSLLCSSGHADMDISPASQPIQGSFLKLLPTQMEMPESLESSPHSSSSSLDQPQFRNR